MSLRCTGLPFGLWGLIVLGMPYRKRLGRVYVGQTVTNVYVGAPCAVLAYRQEETR